MSPSRSRFSRVTSSRTLPFRIVTLVQLGSCRVEDTTYLGRLFSRSAHSPGRAAHRVPNHSSLRRPSSRAAASRASAYSTLPHSSRSLPPSSTNQPPSLKPSLPSGSWTTPSSDTFVLMTIFPMSCSPCLWRTWVAGVLGRQRYRHRGSGRLGGHRPPSSARGRRRDSRLLRIGGRDNGEKRGGGGVLTAALLARARAGDGDAFRELTEPHRRELQ